MPFTAGSPELAKANKLGSILANMHTVYGDTGGTGLTGARVIEQYAKKLGFRITGITTGSAFPPFGSYSPTVHTSNINYVQTAALQNPRGETMASGLALGVNEGRTVGIYLPRIVRDGADYRVTLFSGNTLARSFASTATGISAFGPFTLNRNDRLVFGSNYLIVGGALSGGSAANAAAGVSANIPLLVASGFAAATGDAFFAESVGVTRGTSGIAGATREFYTATGYTATVYFLGANTAAGTTWSVN